MFTRIALTAVLLLNPITMPTALAAELTFEQALSAALLQSPALAASAARQESGREMLIPAAELPDPKLTFGIENLPIEGMDRFRFNGDFMTMRRIGFMQEVPHRAKREADSGVAEAQLALVSAQQDLSTLQVLQQTSDAWIRHYSTERKLALLDAVLAENALRLHAVQAALAGGSGSAVDSVMVRQEAAALHNRRDELLEQQEWAVAALRARIGELADAPVRGEPPEWQVDGDHLNSSLHQHAELALLEPRLKLLDAEIARAEADRKPDWSVGVAYARRARDFEDMLMLEFSIDLPLFANRRQSPRIAASQAEKRAVEADVELMRREHAAMVEADLARQRRLERTSQRQRDIVVPLAREQAGLLLAAWRGNQGSLAEVIAARAAVLESELALLTLEEELTLLRVQLHLTYNSDAISSQLGYTGHLQETTHE
ncbi:MAG: TolC family protein [Gammaproteobacteria bacterium]|nr:TolC family protein [Gammaproteobacteria bacterium]